MENLSRTQARAGPPGAPVFVGRSRSTRRILSLIERSANLDATVLITGESGVGKGLAARLIHRTSRRKAARLVKVPCAALLGELVESELFGHEKGAFTGAHEARPGKVELAEGGTLFLDQVGDMPLRLQPQLLSLLQNRSYERIGGSRARAANVRVIAATHQNLHELCDDGRFRRDLYFRLNVLPLHIPPLRERPSDIPVLADHFLSRISRRDGGGPYSLTDRAMEALTAYDWPGNVRELQNVLKRMTAFCDSSRLSEKLLPPEVLEGRSYRKLPARCLAGLTLKELEKAAIEQTLEMTGGNKALAARHLGISQKTLYNKMRRFGL